MSERDENTAADLLGPLEYEVMRALWTSAPASVPTVLDGLNQVRRKRDRLAYTTVMTVLVRLHNKGILERVRRGRGFDYSPRFDEAGLIEDLSRREVEQLLARYGSVALSQFAAAVDDADPALVARLRRTADRGDRG